MTTACTLSAVMYIATYVLIRRTIYRRLPCRRLVRGIGPSRTGNSKENICLWMDLAGNYGDFYLPERLVFGSLGFSRKLTLAERGCECVQVRAVHLSFELLCTW